MAKNRSYAKKRKAKNARFFILILIVTGLFAAFIIYSNAKMDEEIKNLDQDMTSNTKKLKDLDEKITSLEEDYDIRNTDKFKEKIAEERLGMVKKDSKEEEKEDDDTN